MFTTNTKEKKSKHIEKIKEELAATAKKKTVNHEETAVARVDEKLDEMVETLKVKSREALHEGRLHMQELQKTAKDHPLVSVAIAASVASLLSLGLVAGLLSRRHHQD